jgi:hypothetical protein
MKKKNKPFKISDTPQAYTIEKNKIDNEYYPIFCFKYLNDTSIKDCKKADFFLTF